MSEAKGMDIVVLVRVKQDFDAAIGALSARLSGAPKAVKPAAWDKTADPSHTVAILAGCMLDDIAFLRAQARDGALADWCELNGTLEETLKKRFGGAVELHPLV